MNLSIQAVLILIILLPGFAMLSIYQELSMRKPLSDGQRVISSLIYAAIFYGIQDYFGYSLVMPSGDSAIQSIGVTKVPRASLMIGLATVSLVPTIFAFIRNKDILHKLFRGLKITNSSGRDSTWLDAMESIDCKHQSIRVVMDSGDAYYGNISMHSDEPQEKTICLTNVYYEPVDINGVFPPPRFLKPVKSIIFVNLKAVKFIEVHHSTKPRKEVKKWLKNQLANLIFRSRNRPK